MILSYQGTNRIDFVPSLPVYVPDLQSNATGGNGGFEALSATFDHLDPLFPSSAAITLRNAQVRRISWVRRVRPAGARLSGLLVSAAFRPATNSKDKAPAGPPGADASQRPLTAVLCADRRVPPVVALLDLAFLEFHVLARHRVVLLEDDLLSLIARVLLGHVEIARPGGTHELDLLGDRLGHVVLNEFCVKFATTLPPQGRKSSRRGRAGSPPLRSISSSLLGSKPCM